MFKIFIWGLRALAFLPLWFLYFLSDLLFYLVYYVVRYRRKVVRKNLMGSFPDKNTAEILQIERKFYHYFCDLIVETIYITGISEKEYLQRIKYKNIDLITNFYAQQKSVMMMTAHYCNWEWLSSMSLVLPPEGPMEGIYKELSNIKFDKFMFDLREKFGGRNIENKILFKTMLKNRQNAIYSIYCMISDQRPAPRSSRHWLPFLNQDTSVLIGTEQLARKFEYPVVFLDMRRPKRGYYTCEFIMISEHPQLESENEITRKYMELLENKIIEKPEFWLWTHNRWKHKR